MAQQVEEPVQLIHFNNAASNEGGGIVLNHENWERVLSQAGDRPLSIICICGPSRHGKSFILGHMIRCLEALEKDEPDWMDWDNKDKPLHGFKFRNGTSPETQGVWIWSKPFICSVEDEDEGGKKEIAVLLVDTQGTYDEFTSSRTMASIVGLSLLMSSCLIFNFLNNLQEDVLTSLDSYVQYGLLAQQSNDQSEFKPFQKLMFLIRDWNNPSEFPYGGKGGRSFLQEKLTIKPEQSPEAKQVRENVKSCFETLDCFLLPYPGDSAILPGFKGSISELNTLFAKKMEEFISNLISQDDLTQMVKQVFGNQINGKELKGLLDMYVEMFNSAEMPSPLSMLEATTQVTNQSVLTKAIAKYQVVMKKHLRARNYLSEGALQKADAAGRKQAVEYFKQAKKMGSSERIHDLEDQLDQQISKEFRETKKGNNDKRARYIESEIIQAVTSFKDEMEVDFAFDNDNPLEFYDEKQLQKKSSIEMDNVMEEFHHKIGGDDEEKKMLLQLECKLKETQEEMLLKNRIRVDNADKAVNQLIAKQVSSYKEQMSKFLGQHPFAELIMIEKDHQMLKKVRLDDFEDDNSLPRNKQWRKISLQKLESELDCTYYKIETEHTVKLQEFQLADAELISELTDTYKNEFKNFISNYSHGFPSQVDLESYRETKFKNLSELYMNKCPYNGSPSHAQLHLKAFIEKLNECHQLVLQDLAEKERESKEAIQKAVEEGFNFYHNEMTQHLKASPFLTQFELKARNEDCVEKAKQIFVNVIPNPEDVNEELEHQLISRLIQDFEQLKVDNENKQMLAKSEAKNLVTECHKEYQNCIKEAMGLQRSEDELKTSHVKSMNEAVENFRKKCMVKEEDFVEHFINALKQEILETFEEILELFELKLNEEAGITTEAILTARKYYDDEMNKHFKNNEFIRPHELQKLHDDITIQAVEKSCALVPLTEAQKKELREELVSLYEKFKEENDMNLECDEAAIGIDLGTTYCCLAVYLRGKVHVIPNDLGKKTTPSYVSFNADGSETIGETAKNRAYENPENTIFDAKRIIGRKFTDEHLQSDMKLWPFTVEDDRGVPKIKVNGKTLHPEQISAKILQALKEYAEKFLNCTIKKAVITVPAYFTDGQRQATKDAGELAGLEVLTILTEPVAAAIAYKKQHAGDVHGGNNRNVLIFDLGGGTFDVAVLKTTQGKIDVLAVDGDDHLGGEDFDKNLMEYCAQEFKRQNGVDLLQGKDSENKTTRYDCLRKLKRLQMACERKKIELTASRRVEVTVDSMHGNTDLNVVVTRDTFENMNESLFRKTIEIVASCLEAAKMDRSKINDIVLVGGSTRIPKIQEMLREYFGGQALDISIDPDQAVAYGAAMKAAFINGSITKESIDFTKIQDVTPMSIGVEVYGGGFSVIIPKSTKIPVKLKERYKTAHNNQTSVQVTVYQGEDDIAVNNKHLGDFYLNGIPPNLAEVENIDVEMVINTQGILHVTAVSSSTGRSSNIQVMENKQRMGKAVIKRLLDEAAGAAA